MSAASAIKARLAANSAVVAVVGSNISPQYTAGSPFPRLVYEVEDGEGNYSHGGPVALSRVPIIIHCMVKSTSGVFPYVQARQLAALVRAALGWLAGDTYRTLWGDTVVQKCFYRGALEQELTSSDLGDTGRIVMVSCKFDLWFEDYTS